MNGIQQGLKRLAPVFDFDCFDGDFCCLHQCWLNEYHRSIPNRAALEPITIAQVPALDDSGNVTIAAQAPDQSSATIKINPETGVPDGAILLTIFLKHDQSKTLDQILAELKQSDYLKAFPPKGVDVVSWYVVMGIGQVVTLAVPPERLRAVNVAPHTILPKSPKSQQNRRCQVAIGSKRVTTVP